MLWIILLLIGMVALSSWIRRKAEEARRDE